MNFDLKTIDFNNVRSVSCSTMSFVLYCKKKNYIKKEPEFILLRVNRLLIFKRMEKRNTEVKNLCVSF